MTTVEPGPFDPPDVPDATTCPACGDGFDSYRGVSAHHWQVHDDDIPVEWKFWSRVDTGDPDECWEWTAGTFPAGYGCVCIDGESAYANRVALLLSGERIDIFAGDSRRAQLALHHCDNKPCCNPAHLYVGTAADNALDAIERGRAAVGEDNWNSKLTPDDVLEIRERCASGDETFIELADEFGVGPENISSVVRGRTWKHVGGPIADNDYEGPDPSPSGSSHGNSKLTETTVLEIRERYADGDVSQADIATEYGMRRRHVGAIVNGESWSDAGGPIAGNDYPRRKNTPSGSSNGNSKLTEDDVLEIRERYESERTPHRDLASEYGVSKTQIGQIVNGDRWTDAPGPIKGEDYE